LFEVADWRHPLLDEVGELNKNIQVKLLRFLESGESAAWARPSPSAPNVRVLCATIATCAEMIQSDEFAKTFTSGVKRLKFACRRCASAAKTFPISLAISWPAPPPA